MVERGQVYNIVNAGLFCILLVLFYVLYMEKAVENYMKKSTTIVERPEEIIEMKSPVFVLCPDPPFKTSFFRDLDPNKTKGAENFFWVHPMFHTIFDNKSVSAMEIYTNMSYQLGVDINMFLYHWIPEYVYSGLSNKRRATFINFSAFPPRLRSY